MISEWFGINLSIKGVVKLCTTILLFNLINTILCYTVGIDIPIGITVHEILWPISTNRYWFISAYLLLMITSPLIYTGLKNMTLKQTRLFMLLFTFYTIYSSNLGMNECNVKGYSFLQGLYMYCLAYYLKLENIADRFTKLQCIAGYLCISLLMGIVFAVWHRFSEFCHYNNILVIIATISVFFFCLKLNIKNNKIINTLAAASLGCYLLQEGVFDKKFVYGWMTEWYLNYPSLIWILVFMLVFIGTWAASLLVSKPISIIANRIGTYADNQFFNRINNYKIKRTFDNIN